MSDAQFEVDAALICDDIRREDNGKAILIGVYAGDIVLSRLPATIPIALWLQGRASSGVHEVSVNVYAGEEPTTEVTSSTAVPLKVVIDKEAEFFLVITGLPVKVIEPASLIVRMREGQDDWIVIAKKHILLASPGDSPATDA
jgi:hypothetical protein